MATFKIILRKNKIKRNGNHPIALRISKGNKSTYFTLKFDCNKNQWEEGASRFNYNYPNYRKVNKILTGIEDKIETVINELKIENEYFTLDDIKNRFREGKSREKRKNTYSFIEYMDEIISDLMDSNKVGNAKVYRDTKNSFIKYLGKDYITLTFKGVNLRLLNKYLVYLRSLNNKDGGIAVKFRTLRAVYNKAIKENYADASDYPFNNFNFGQFKEKRNYEVLDRDEVNRIINLNIENQPQLKLTKDTFLFSYYLGGMNFIDLIQLEWKHIVGDKLAYTRSKTSKNFKFSLNNICQDIIEYYRGQNNSTKYIFPYLTMDNLTQNQIFNRKDKTLKKYNKELKEIAKLSKINKNITSYVARHSFANNLKKSGADKSIISQALGHKSQKVTDVYLRELDNELIDEAIAKL